MNIALENIAFAYTGDAFLQGVTAELAPGKVHFLAGPNGSGKSTLLKISAGYLAPDAGKIKLDDRDLTAYSGMERARHLGVMWQSSNPALDFTVREMVEITASARFPRLQKLSPADEEIIENSYLFKKTKSKEIIIKPISFTRLLFFKSYLFII